MKGTGQGAFTVSRRPCVGQHKAPSNERNMSRRKGWDNLKPDYRKRLIKKGITRAAYESGADLSAARSHPHPAGITEREWEALVRSAMRADWPKSEWPDKQSVKNMLERELDRGIPLTEIKKALDLKVRMQTLWIVGARNEARKLYAGRQPAVEHKIYWYHPGG